MAAISHVGAGVDAGFDAEAMLAAGVELINGDGIVEIMQNATKALINHFSRALKATRPLEKRAAAFRWAAGEDTRLALRPIIHEDIWEFRKKLEGLHWTAQEVDYTKDLTDWSTRMTSMEREFVKYQLAFFARIDIDVLGNLDENFGDEVDCLEARMVYAAQKDQECVHAESYSLQIEAVLSGEERDQVLNAVKHMPIIALMRKWVISWTNRESRSFGERLVAFIFVEGVLFSGSFCALQWLKHRNLLPGITKANDFISRDEGVHTSHGCLLIRKYLIGRPSQARVEQILEEMVSIVDRFVSEALSVRLIGMNADLMKQYVRFQSDCVLADMGYAAKYRVSNPFPFMDAMTLNEVSKTNFFERATSEYQSITKTGHTRLVIDTDPIPDDP
jgi:ribonucleotide reductase beta subunit family protein with ferritin-like domain